MTPPLADTLVRWATRWDAEALVKLLAALAAHHDVTPVDEELRESFQHALGFYRMPWLFDLLVFDLLLHRLRGPGECTFGSTVECTSK